LVGMFQLDIYSMKSLQSQKSIVQEGKARTRTLRKRMLVRRILVYMLRRQMLKLNMYLDWLFQRGIDDMKSLQYLVGKIQLGKEYTGQTRVLLSKNLQSIG